MKMKNKARSLKNAKNAKGGRTPFPQMGGYLPIWSNSMTFSKITQEIVDFESVEFSSDFECEGVFEPMRGQAISFKPEGQRAWSWWDLWTQTGYDIHVGDNIVDFKGNKYRVMKRNDWAQGGYYQFELVQDYVAEAGI